MSQTDLQKDIMKAVKKVNKMNINLGQSQYQGRGMDSSEEVEVEPAPVVVSDPRENIYDEEEDRSIKAAKDVMKEIKRRVTTTNLGQPDSEKLMKRLNKINNSLGGSSVGGKSLKGQFKFLKSTNPSLYYKLKAEVDPPKREIKGKKPKVKRAPSEKQKEWHNFVKELSQKEKYKGMGRPELMKVASKKYKKSK